MSDDIITDDEGNATVAAPTAEATAAPLRLVEESTEFTEQDQNDLAKLLAEPPTYHTLLQVWREVIAPAKDEAIKRVQPQWASRVTSTWPAISVQEMEVYRDRYFGKIAELSAILEAEIEAARTPDNDPLSHLDAEADREQNADVYKNLLLLWQQAILQWELDWDCTHKHAHIELAAISEVHKMFFSQTGLVNFLDQIGFVFTEDDQLELQEALQEFRGDR
jgi:hypothetical protein